MLKIGDWVNIICDNKQYGKVIEIKRNWATYGSYEYIVSEYIPQWNSFIDQSYAGYELILREPPEHIMDEYIIKELEE